MDEKIDGISIHKCPECGSEATIVTRKDGLMRVECTHCPRKSKYDSYPGGAIRQWNEFAEMRERQKAEAKKTPESPPQYPQDEAPNEYRYLSPAWIDDIAEGLTAGAKKHPGETWRQIPRQEHLFRAMRHIVMYLAGDRTEPHIINASMRLMMSYETDLTEDKEDEE